MNKQLLIFLLAALMLGSCSYKRKNILFKTEKRIKTKEPVTVVSKDSLRAWSTYKHVIKVGDRVDIRFLNSSDIGTTPGMPVQTQNAIGYLVNFDSTVTLPLIGRINIVGKTRLEAATYLEDKYSKFLNNPIIDVNILSLTATVLGEVTTQGLITIDKEQTTLVELIARAGGIKETGKKNDIKIIRNNQIILVNLKEIIALQSPDIIIHHNDIVYVQPYGVKAQTESFSGLQNTTQLVFALVQLTLVGLQIYFFAQRF
jgi:polysaccharide export outer membrane protein